MFIQEMYLWFGSKTIPKAKPVLKHNSASQSKIDIDEPSPIYVMMVDHYIIVLLYYSLLILQVCLRLIPSPNDPNNLKLKVT